jgi:hypothetical protein
MILQTREKNEKQELCGPLISTITWLMAMISTKSGINYFFFKTVHGKFL